MKILIVQDGRFTAGGGATDIELAKQVQAWAETHPGLEQYSIKKFGEALEVSLLRCTGSCRRLQDLLYTDLKLTGSFLGHFLI